MSENTPNNASVEGNLLNDSARGVDFEDNLRMSGAGSSQSPEQIKNHADMIVASRGQDLFKKYEHLGGQERAQAIEQELRSLGVDGAIAGDYTNQVVARYENPLEIPASQQSQTSQSQEVQGGGPESLFGGLFAAETAVAANDAFFSNKTENQLATSGELRGTDVKPPLSPEMARFEQGLPESAKGVALEGGIKGGDNLTFPQMEGQLAANAQRAQTAAISAGVMPDRGRDGASMSFA